MNKPMDMKALLMKIEVSYNSAMQHVDLSKHDTYTIARKLIDLIEDNNGKKLQVKRSFTLVQGGDTNV